MNVSVEPVTRIPLTRFSGLAAVPPYYLALSVSASYNLRSVWASALPPYFSGALTAAIASGFLLATSVLTIYLSGRAKKALAAH